MNTNTIEKNWTELKGKIKSKWNKFSDAEVESVKGDLNLLAEKIQKVYGIAKDHADRQFDEFKSSVQSLIGQGNPVQTTSSIFPKPAQAVAAPSTQVAEPVAVKDSKVS